MKLTPHCDVHVLLRTSNWGFPKFFWHPYLFCPICQNADTWTIYVLNCELCETYKSCSTIISFEMGHICKHDLKIDQSHLGFSEIQAELTNLPNLPNFCLIRLISLISLFYLILSKIKNPWNVLKFQNLFHLGIL